MNPLNDDELTALLQQAKAKPPQASPALAARTLRAYRERVAPPPFWRRAAAWPASHRWRVGALAALLLILMGTLGSQVLGPSTDVGQEEPGMPQRAVPQARDLTLKNLQPVPQVEPRVVRSMKDDQP
jgi:hypothetical protein